MSDPAPRVIDIDRWVRQARSDPLAYRERQAIEIVLSAIGSLPDLGSQIFLKGGILMAIFYGSPRTTADIDFTTRLAASADLPGKLREALDKELPRAAARLGFADLVLRVQSVREQPRPFARARLSFPALEVTIAYAERGSAAERHFRQGQGQHTVNFDMSFNEPVHAIEVVRLGEGGPLFRAYALTDLIAEKFRALLQQVTRNRYRRQDVYDIAFLARHFPPGADQRADILAAFREKCAARGIVPSADSLSQPAVREHARAEWDTLKQELADVPEFDACFATVQALYRALPWT